MKKIILSLFCFLMIFSLGSNVSFASADSIESTEETANDQVDIDEGLRQFLTNKNLDEVEFLEENGNPLSRETEKEIRESIISGNLSKANEIMLDRNILMFYETTTRTRNGNRVSKHNEMIPMGPGPGADLPMDVKNWEIRHLKKDLSNKFTKEWYTYLSFSYRVSQSGQISMVTPVKVNVYTKTFGKVFNVTVSNIYANYSYSGDRKNVYINGGYRLKARAEAPITIGGYWAPIGKTFDWGQITFNKTLNRYTQTN